MDRASAHYASLGWQVEDVSRHQPFDLRCIRDGAELHVEVKGTTTAGAEIRLTEGEVRHARSFPATALFVFSSIRVNREPNGADAVQGGADLVVDPWHLSESSLTPTHYTCRIA